MRRVLPLCLLSLLAFAPTALAAEEPPGGDWTETYIQSGERSDGGPKLHVDIIRPEGIPEDRKTPVLLTVSPYTNHSGQPLTPDPDPGPSSRFYDFLELGQVLQKGYTYVVVDLRGFGGSDGCNDWGGPGEQSDVKEAVEWAARQEWSTGRVALYGKSYDAWTGMMALKQRPNGLAAVIAQEPVVDGYKYLYMNRVPFSNRVGTPALFQVIDAQPGHPLDDPEYQITGAPKNPACLPKNIADQQDDDPESAYWKPRDLIEAVKGNATPTFLTQGYLETNTKPDGVFRLWNNLTGPNKAWFGQFDHVRMHERDADTDESLTGRETWVGEAMRFLDHHVKGLPLDQAATDRDPTITVQDIEGRWRSEQQWPPADAQSLRTPLRTGEYADDGGNDGIGEGGGNGIWTFSQPLERDLHLAGTPSVRFTVDATGPANFVANVYDVSPRGEAVMISRGAMMLESGEHDLELYGQDWPVRRGHRLGVLLSDANDEWFDHEHTDETVKITAAEVTLPLLADARAANLEGGDNPRLREFLDEAPFIVGRATIAEGSRTFALPAGSQAGSGSPQGTGGGSPSSNANAATIAGGTPTTGRARRGTRTARWTLSTRLRRAGGRRVLVVRGRSARTAGRVLVRVQRSGRTVTTRPATVRRGRFVLRVRVARGGRYTARVVS